MKLSTLAAHLGATLQGDPDVEITSAAGLEEAQPGQLAFVANPKYIPHARTTHASAVLVEPKFEQITAATLRIDNPYLAFARALELLYEAAGLCTWNPSHRRHRSHRKDRSRRPYRRLRGGWRSRGHWRKRHAVAPRGDLSPRAYWQPLFCARPRRGPRELPRRRPRHSAERRHHRLGWLRLRPPRETRTRPGRLVQNSPDRPSGSRRSRRDPGQLHHRPRHCRRDSHRRRRKDRQPRPGWPCGAPLDRTRCSAPR